MTDLVLRAATPGFARRLLMGALALTVLGGAALLLVDGDRAATRVSMSQPSDAPGGSQELVVDDGSTSPAATAADPTTTTTRKRIVSKKPLSSVTLPDIPIVRDLLPTGWVAFEEADGLVAVRADGSRRVMVSLPGEKVLGASWSPLVDEIAYFVENSPQLRLVNVETGAARTFDLGAAPWNYTYATPKWSPLGTHVAASTTQSLVVVSAVTGEIRATGAPLDEAFAFSPNGLFIAGHLLGCTSMHCTDHNLVIVPVVDGERKTIPITSGYYPRSPLWSIDGTRLAFSVGKDMADTTTAVIGIDGQGERIVLRGASPLRWDPLRPNGLFMQREPTGVRYAVVDSDSVKTIGPEGASMPGVLSPNGLIVAYGQSCDQLYAACLRSVDRDGDNDKLVAKLSWAAVAGWTAESASVVIRERASDDFARVIVHSITSDKVWVLSERAPLNVLTPDSYMYPSRALL